MLRFTVVAGLFLAVALLAVAGDKQYCEVNFVVLKDANGKPIKYASVVLHPVDEHGRQERGGMQLKTDGDGKATAPSIPYGKLRVQVIASGYQTYGEDFNIAEPAKEITIKLKRPQDQYSIYK